MMHMHTVGIEGSLLYACLVGADEVLAVQTGRRKSFQVENRIVLMLKQYKIIKDTFLKKINHNLEVS